MEYATTSVIALAMAETETLGASTDGYRPYEAGGATRAAALIAELL